MDVTIKKKAGKTTIETAEAHPTWVNRTPKGTYSPDGYPLFLYQTYILEDFIEGGASSLKNWMRKPRREV